MKDVSVLIPVLLDEIPGANDIASEYSTYQIPDYGAWLNELRSTGIELSVDPVAEGIGKLNAQIAQIDAQKTRAASIMSAVITNEANLNSFALKVNAIYKQQFDSRLPLLSLIHI